jgi:hypothetical protein
MSSHISDGHVISKLYLKHFLIFDVAFYIEVAADKRFDLRELQVNTTLL